MNTTNNPDSLFARILRSSLVLAAAVVAVSTVATVSASAEQSHRARAEVSAASDAKAARPLPREWVWNKRAVNFDSMHRAR